MRNRTVAQPVEVAAGHRYIDIARHPRGQRVLFGNVQKNSHSTNQPVLDTGGSQSGCDALQYFEKLLNGSESPQREI
jgi:hypothetical protein